MFGSVPAPTTGQQVSSLGLFQEALMTVEQRASVRSPVAGPRRSSKALPGLR